LGRREKEGRKRKGNSFELDRIGKGRKKRKKKLDLIVVVDEADITERAVCAEDKLVITVWSLCDDFRLLEWVS